MTTDYTASAMVSIPIEEYVALRILAERSRVIESLALTDTDSLKRVLHVLLPDKDCQKDTMREPEQTGGEDSSSVKPKRNLDVGKIMALYKAGWSNSQIADEMHESAQRIAAIIRVRKSESDDEAGEKL